jgi:hypothetical protein
MNGHFGTNGNKELHAMARDMSSSEPRENLSDKDFPERYLAHSRPILAGSDERSLFVSNRGRRSSYTNISFMVRNYGKRGYHQAREPLRASPYLRHAPAAGQS